VRKDTGQGYDEFLRELAQASGIDTPTREDLTRIDKSRKNKASNDDGQNPHDPDAKITKMKDGRTHLAHKDESRRAGRHDPRNLWHPRGRRGGAGGDVAAGRCGGHDPLAGDGGAGLHEP
jgi:hypothetical protein